MKTNKLFLHSLLILTLSNNLKADLTSQDTLFSKQWAIKNIGQTVYLQDSDLTREKMVGIPGVDINYVDTSAITSTKNELIVAVLDSGIDLAQPDLKDRIWYNKNLCTNAPNAKNLPCNGFNFLDNNTNLLDDVGHGTHVAGVIAANKNNIGIMGAADPRIKIMPLKVLNSTVNGFVYNGKLITDVIADAMVFAIKNGAEVINLSLGWPKLIDTAKVRAAFQMAEEQNVIVIAAAGNNNKDLPTFPCSYESVICVGAHDNQGNLTDFTNHGSKVDITAPGEYIVSTYPSNLESRVLRIKNYEAKRGSSQAAPFVTAAVATLKLLKPNLKNDQVRSLLFNSVKKSQLKDSRFVKFGMLDYKHLLEIEEDKNNSFINPLLKNITEVKFNYSDKKFQFNLPIKNLSNIPFSGEVCISPESETLSVDNTCNAVSINPISVGNILVSGSINDLSIDSKVNFQIKIGERIFILPIFFTRNLNNDSELKSIPVSGSTFDDMGIISNGRRLSKMMRIMDKQNLVGFPEYSYLEKLKQSEANTNLSILTKVEDKYIVKTILLPKVNKVLSVHRQDFNLDGKLDYMVYALSNSKDTLQLFFYDQNMNPLFGLNSTWNWPLTTFEGLPIDGGIEKFDWVKIKSNELGNILVPALTRISDMPEDDNSKNILDRVVSRANHEFYLNPIADKNGITIKLRVLDSVKMIKQMRMDLKLTDAYRIEVIKTIPQTVSSYSNGIVQLFAKAANDEEVKYFEIKTNVDGTIYNSLQSDLPLETAAIYGIYSLTKNKFSGENVFTSLVNRSRANYVLRDQGNLVDGKDLVNNWENPIISLIGAFQTENSKLFLMENRYSVSFSDQNGSFKYELPVYRDSSFPGQNFSETLNPIVSEGRPGVYVNSTLIFGERIYSMIGDEKGLIRPMNLSTNIPDGCIPLNPEFIGDRISSNFMFLCGAQSSQVSIKYLPMSQN